MDSTILKLNNFKQYLTNEGVMLIKRALIVGIDDYSHPLHPLGGCVNDAKKMHKVLSSNEDGSPNFDCKLLTAAYDEVTRVELKAQRAGLSLSTRKLMFLGGIHDEESPNFEFRVEILHRACPEHSRRIQNDQIGLFR